jgi:hypothetical protein
MAAIKPLPPCGLYKTTSMLGDVPPGRLVYFHNHGDPGPGVYLPKKWVGNRAEFEGKGFMLPEPVQTFAATLEPLPDEGFYRVTKEFFCCEKRCQSFEAEMLVQLGYNATGEAILFVPELSPDGIAVPDTGAAIGAAQLRLLSPLKVVDPSEEEETEEGDSVPPGTLLH